MNYINAHATSTLVGDVAELKAVKKVFTDTSNLKMNATKSMIGHCLGAAGGMEAVATIKAITTGWLHPTINHVRNDVLIDAFFHVQSYFLKPCLVWHHTMLTHESSHCNCTHYWATELSVTKLILAANVQPVRCT